MTWSTEKPGDVSLTGTSKICNDCTVRKARHKYVPKATVKRANIPGGRMFTDILSPKFIVIGGQKHSLLSFRDASDCGFSIFVSHKDMLTFKLVPFIKKLKEEFTIFVGIIHATVGV